MMFGSLSLAAAFALLLTGAVSAQTASDPGATSVEDVAVTAATRRGMEAYARDVGSGPMGRLSPRWNDRICVRVVYMDAEHAAYLKDRVATVAEAIGLSPDRSPDCRADISIFASDDPDALAAELLEAAPRNFRPALNGVSLGNAALEAFLTSDAPVRWWQVSLPLMEDSGEIAIALKASEPGVMARSVVVRNASRLRGNVRDDLAAVTIILDTRQLVGVPFSAVSDYVAFVALAPADPRVDTERFDTVLNLFRRPGLPGLTATDGDYLYALYSASRAPINASVQAAEIADRMATERRRRGSATQ